MKSDQLLQLWKKAKQICQKVIQISKNANLHNKISESPMQKQTNKQFMSVYDTVYRLCITKQKQQTRVIMVYKDFKDILKNSVLSMSQQLRLQKDIYRLKYLRKIWEAYIDILKRLTNMFAYLNRSFYIKEGKIEELDKTGMGIIVNQLFSENSITEYQAFYFREIQKIRRSNDFSNASILKDFVDMLYKIHLKLIKNINKKAITRYTQFHLKYLKLAKQFYQKKYSFLKELGPTQYFEQVDKMYKSQVKISVQCFGIVGQSLINKQFSQQFIQKYRQTLMKSQKGLKNILENRKISTLKIVIQMYIKLTKNIQGFKQQFQQFIFEDFKSHMEQLRNQILIKRNITSYCGFMQKLMQKNKEYLEMLRQQFMHLGDFIAYYKTGVEKAFNSIKLPIPIEEILTIYIDYKLKLTNLDELEMEEIIKNIMAIFVCIENKDSFLMKYTQKLAKKLLIISPDSIKNHELFLQNLKFNYGIKFTQRVQTLIYQYNVAYQYQKEIKSILQSRKVNLDFNVKIFSEGSWPTSNIIDIPINYFPNVIQNANQCLKIYRDQFNVKKTYKISFLESKFRWLYFFDKEVENKLPECYFQTNCLQGSLLYYIYQKRPQRVPLQLLQKTYQKISTKIIRENLNKMVQIEQNVLIRQNDNEQVYYQFNSKMKSSRRLIMYESAITTQEEKLFQQQDLGRDRQIILEANITKFMKSRKITDFETLIMQIPKMIKVFNPQTRDIKIAVDRLISKQFLERDDKDINKIRYMD